VREKRAGNVLDKQPLIPQRSDEGRRPVGWTTKNRFPEWRVKEWALLKERRKKGMRISIKSRILSNL
jgi:hypothetical protein